MTQQLAVRPSGAAKVAAPSLSGCGGSETGRRAGRPSSGKEVGQVVGGHCGGAEVNTMPVGQHVPIQRLSAPGPASFIAIPAASETTGPPCAGHGNPDLAPLTGYSGRDGGPLSGAAPQRPRAAVSRLLPPPAFLTRKAAATRERPAA